MIRWSYSFVNVPHYLIIKFYRPIWKYWTSKMFARYIPSRMCLRLSQFCQLSFIQYMGLRVFTLPIYLMMIGRILVLYPIIIIKSECLGQQKILCVLRKYSETYIAYHCFMTWPYTMSNSSYFIFLAIITREMGKLKTHSPIYCIMDDWENILNLTHTLDKIYLTGIL